MTISQVGPRHISAYTSQVKVKERVDRVAVAGSSADTLEISPKAREMQTFRSTLANISGVREVLVTDLKKRIQDAEYHPAGDKIAAAILKERASDKQALNGDSSG